MRKFSIIMPFFALLAGVAGLYVRLKEIGNVFDGAENRLSLPPGGLDYGLPMRGATVTYALIALAAAFLVVSLFFAQRASTGYKSSKGFGNAYGPDSLAYPFAIVLFSLLWLGSTMKQFIDLKNAGPMPLGDVYFIVLSALSALAMLIFAIAVYQDPKRKSALVLSVIPVLFACYWLIILYKQNASNPILLSYCYYCLAIMFAALSFYFTASFVFEKQATGKAIFSYLASIFFCMVTLADKHTVGMKLILAAIIATSTVHSSMLIRNLTKEQS